MVDLYVVSSPFTVGRVGIDSGRGRRTYLLIQAINVTSNKIFRLRHFIIKRYQD